MVAPMSTPSELSSATPSIKIISGGQTGADRAGLDVAIARGIPHGGWCPKGRKSEDGSLHARYLLSETPSANYLVRTERNAAESDATVIFTAGALSGGSKRTAEFAKKHGRPFLHLILVPGREEHAAERLAAFVRQHRVTLASKVLDLSLDMLGFASPESIDDRLR
jgi:predicted Rossmann fold nucleotide-binding protein DprA/Smf involved in DNA uptake